MSGYVFHPEASTDLDEIWEYIAEDKHRCCRRDSRRRLLDSHHGLLDHHTSDTAALT